MTEKRYFIIDVEETHQENAVWQYDDKLDDYDFVCFEDDSDKLVMKLNEFAEENKELKKQMKRLYNYFMDWHSDEMGGNQFSEMWDIVKESERWEEKW